MRALRLCLAGAAALALSACGGGRDASDADPDRTLHRGNQSEPLTLDPHVAVLMDTRQILSDLYAGLYEPGPDAQPVLSLAESVEVSPSGRTWTFTLREGLVWSDGVALTADDVVAGLRRPLDPATRNHYPSPFFMIENAEDVAGGRRPPEELGVEALDARTVVVRLAYPAPYLPSVLMYWGQPVPRHALEAYGESWVRPENAVTSGAYTLEEWRSNEYVRLAKNPRYHAADSVCMETVFYYPTADVQAAERRVRAGELDLNTEFQPSSLAFLRERAPELIRMTPGFTYINLTFNTDREPFDDVRVRRALSLAIDRRFLVEEVLGGADTPAFRVIPEGLSGRPGGVGLGFEDRPMQDRRDQARALLTDAGYGPDRPLRFTLHYTPGAGLPRAAPVLQQDWAEIAPWVEAEILVRDRQLHYDAMRADDFQVATSGWVPDFDDPYAYLLKYESAAGEMNYSNWTDAVFDAAAARGARAAEPQARAQAFAEAEQRVLDVAVEAPLYHLSVKGLVRPDITGYVANPQRINQSRWMCREGLQSSAP